MLGPRPNWLKELVATNADCYVTSCHQCLGPKKKAEDEHTAQTADGLRGSTSSYHQGAVDLSLDSTDSFLTPPWLILLRQKISLIKRCKWHWWWVKEKKRALSPSFLCLFSWTDSISWTARVISFTNWLHHRFNVPTATKQTLIDSPDGLVFRGPYVIMQYATVVCILHKQNVLCKGNCTTNLK